MREKQRRQDGNEIEELIEGNRNKKKKEMKEKTGCPNEGQHVVLKHEIIKILSH